MSDNRPDLKLEQYSIVVVGAMNPAIHHPHWYQAVEMLSEEDAQFAMDKGHLLIMPQLAQFSVEDFELQCTPDKWQVTTSSHEKLNRLMELAVKTFELLHETPVSSYGLNSRFSVDTDLQDVGEVLGKQLEDGPLKLTIDNLKPILDSMTVSYALPLLEVDGQPSVDRKLSATISRSPQTPNKVMINLNGAHKLKQDSESVHFDIGVLLRASEDIQKSADSFLKAILTSLSELEA